MRTQCSTMVNRVLDQLAHPSIWPSHRSSPQLALQEKTEPGSGELPAFSPTEDAAKTIPTGGSGELLSFLPTDEAAKTIPIDGEQEPRSPRHVDLFWVRF